MNTRIYSKNESYARPDGQVKRYHSALITEVSEVCRSRLPQFVRAEDFDCVERRLHEVAVHCATVEQERDQLQRDNDRLMGIARDLTITIHSNLGSTELDERCQADLAALENKA